MKPFLVLYATREGHTQRIADRIVARLRERGRSARVHDVRRVRESLATFDLFAYESAILAASVHLGNHEPEMVAFVKLHRAALTETRSVFISVSMAQAAAEDTTRPAAEREEAAAGVQSAIAKFVTATGWKPERALPVAGALMYSRYNFLVRFMMKQIAKKGRMPTDTSRDHDLTDWKALDALVDEIVLARSSRDARQDLPAPL